MDGGFGGAKGLLDFELSEEFSIVLGLIHHNLAIFKESYKNLSNIDHNGNEH